MKKEVRKALAISGLAIALGTSGMALDANASMMGGRNPRSERQMRPTPHGAGLRGNSFGNRINNASGFMQRHRRIIPGVVAEITDNSLTITQGEKTFTVNTTDTTRFLNLKWEAISLSDIKVGDNIRVAGDIVDTTITATTVRDISL